ncbi:MAG: hypothetical protein EBV68_09785, partial [Betaproteobacteria bacterium]|nr:hypothetical protein [Betaproteobacteria bacterium]
LRGLWQKIQRYGKMLAAVTRHIAKIRCSPAHKVAQPSPQNTQTFEAAVRFFDADAYVIAACQCVAQQHTTHLFAQPQVKATKVVERFWICSETGPYVVPKGETLGLAPAVSGANQRVCVASGGTRPGFIARPFVFVLAWRKSQAFCFLFVPQADRARKPG